MPEAATQQNTTTRFEDFLYEHGFITKPVFDRLMDSKKRNPTQTLQQIVLAEKMLEEEDLARQTHETR